MLEYDLVVVGGGPAGLAAAIEAKKNGIDNILVVERDKELGGILQQCIHNGFGLHIFKEELTGPEYAERFIVELMSLGIEYTLDTMAIDINNKKVVTIINPDKGLLIIKAKAIVLAMGCRERTRGAINIAGSRPAGVYNAGLVQRLINIEGYNVGKKAIILGSGDIGMIMARRLVIEGTKVVGVLSRGSYANGLTRNIVQCLKDFNIPLLLNHTIIKINGKDRVSSVIVAKTDINKKIIPGYEKEYECDTVLISVGLIPENELSTKAGVSLDKRTGGPLVDENMETEINGIFACGNVLHVHDIVDFVTYESRKAGENAARYIKGKSSNNNECIETDARNGVMYIVPQRIGKDNNGNIIEFFMRVNDIYENINIVIKLDDEIIKKVKRKFMVPSEMEKIVLDSRILKFRNGSVLSFEIVKRED